MIRNENKQTDWKKENAGGGQRFSYYVQVFSDKAATSLKSTALIAYYAHTLLMNFKYIFWQSFVENGHTVVGYMPMKSIWTKEIAAALSATRSSTWYSFSGSEECEREKAVP